MFGYIHNILNRFLRVSDKLWKWACTISERCNQPVNRHISIDYIIILCKYRYIICVCVMCSVCLYMCVITVCVKHIIRIKMLLILS